MRIDIPIGTLEVPNRNAQPVASVNLAAISTRRSRPPFLPEIGDEVIFRRTPSHEPETGYVRARQFCTLEIDVVDTNAKPLHLNRHQYDRVKKGAAWDARAAAGDAAVKSMRDGFLELEA